MMFSARLEHGKYDLQYLQGIAPVADLVGFSGKLAGNFPDFPPKILIFLAKLSAGEHFLDPTYLRVITRHSATKINHR